MKGKVTESIHCTKTNHLRCSRETVADRTVALGRNSEPTAIDESGAGSKNDALLRGKLGSGRGARPPGVAADFGVVGTGTETGA